MGGSLRPPVRCVVFVVIGGGRTSCPVAILVSSLYISAQHCIIVLRLLRNRIIAPDVRGRGIASLRHMVSCADSRWGMVHGLAGQTSGTCRREGTCPRDGVARRGALGEACAAAGCMPPAPPPSRCPCCRRRRRLPSWAGAWRRRTRRSPAASAGTRNPPCTRGLHSSTVRLNGSTYCGIHRVVSVCQ